ncbi:MAG: hypothetical protein HQK60_18825 [Deltaproteobacteria bacterium]|nr:hypothetical protein [Deltaproteobacteria bacterium]
MIKSKIWTIAARDEIAEMPGNLMEELVLNNDFANYLVRVFGCTEGGLGSEFRVNTGGRNVDILRECTDVSPDISNRGHHICYSTREECPNQCYRRSMAQEGVLKEIERLKIFMSRKG